jgi:hypothetical protein
MEQVAADVSAAVVVLLDTNEAVSAQVNEWLNIEFRKSVVWENLFETLDMNLQPCPWTYFDKKERTDMIDAVERTLSEDFKRKFTSKPMLRIWLTTHLHKLWTTWAGEDAEFPVDRITNYRFKQGQAEYLTEYVGHKWAEWKPYEEVYMLTAFQTFCDVTGKNPNNPGKQDPAPRKRKTTGNGRGHWQTKKKRN